MSIRPDARIRTAMSLVAPPESRMETNAAQVLAEAGRWIGRFVAATAAMAAWMIIILALVAFLLPEPSQSIEDRMSKAKDAGVYVDLSINVLLGSITGFYY